jgi:hypothetical protein
MPTHSELAAQERKKIAEYIGIPIPGHFMPQYYASMFQEPGVVITIIGFMGPNLIRLEVLIPGRESKIHGYSAVTIGNLIAGVEQAVRNGHS